MEVSPGDGSKFSRGFSEGGVVFFPRYHTRQKIFTYKKYKRINLFLQKTSKYACNSPGGGWSISGRYYFPKKFFTVCPPICRSIREFVTAQGFAPSCKCTSQSRSCNRACSWTVSAIAPQSSCPLRRRSPGTSSCPAKIRSFRCRPLCVRCMS